MMVETNDRPQLDNPFSNKRSGYGVFNHKVFSSTYPPNSLEYRFHLTAHDYFRELVLDPGFACIAGQSAVRSGNYVFCAYPDMADYDMAEGVCHDLRMYMLSFDVHSIPKHEMRFNSFIATFNSPVIETQLDGARNLYRLLLNMHRHDVAHGFAWNPGVSIDTESPEFGYSNAGDSFYIPLLYSCASSTTRKSEYTYVIFNSHLLFEKLRTQGTFEKLKATIRGRIHEVHPNLIDYGQGPEFPQYALVDNTPQAQISEKQIREEVLGKCPFKN